MSMPIDDKTRLSRTQVVILWMLARGVPTKLIAAERRVGYRTVYRAIESARDIMGIASRDELLANFKMHLLKRQWTDASRITKCRYARAKMYRRRNIAS